MSHALSFPPLLRVNPDVRMERKYDSDRLQILRSTLYVSRRLKPL